MISKKDEAPLSKLIVEKFQIFMMDNDENDSCLKKQKHKRNIDFYITKTKTLNYFKLNETKFVLKIEIICFFFFI